jgi:hypothetical protein
MLSLWKFAQEISGITHEESTAMTGKQKERLQAEMKRAVEIDQEGNPSSASTATSAASSSTSTLSASSSSSSSSAMAISSSSDSSSATTTFASTSASDGQQGLTPEQSKIVKRNMDPVIELTLYKEILQRKVQIQNFPITSISLPLKPLLNKDEIEILCDKLVVQCMMQPSKEKDIKQNYLQDLISMTKKAREKTVPMSDA